MTYCVGVVTVQEKRGVRRCEWCRRPVEATPVGRPKKFCRQSCRQRAYEARRRSVELGLGDDELVVTRNELNDANDRLAEVLVSVSEARRDVDDGLAESLVLDRLLTALSANLDTNP